MVSLFVCLFFFFRWARLFLTFLAFAFLHFTSLWQISDRLLHDEKSSTEILYFCSQTLRTKVTAFSIRFRCRILEAVNSLDVHNQVGRLPVQVQRDYEELPPEAVPSLKTSLLVSMWCCQQGEVLKYECIDMERHNFSLAPWVMQPWCRNRRVIAPNLPTLVLSMSDTSRKVWQWSSCCPHTGKQVREQNHCFTWSLILISLALNIWYADYECKLLILKYEVSCTFATSALSWTRQWPKPWQTLTCHCTLIHLAKTTTWLPTRQCLVKKQFW